MRNLTANFGKSLDICKISSKNLVNEHQKSQRNDYPTIYQFYQKQTDWKNQICAGLIPPTSIFLKIIFNNHFIGRTFNKYGFLT